MIKNAFTKELFFCVSFSHLSMISVFLKIISFSFLFSGKPFLLISANVPNFSVLHPLPSISLLVFFGFSSLVMTSICEAISSNQLALRFGVGVVWKGYGYKMGCYLKGQQKSPVSSLLIIFVIKLSQNPWTPPHMTVMSFLDNHLNLINLKKLRNIVNCKIYGLPDILLRQFCYYIFHFNRQPWKTS